MSKDTNKPNLQETPSKKTEELVNEKEAILAEKEKALQERERLLSVTKSEVSTTEPKKRKGLEFSFRDRSYKFSDEAPEQILFAGEVVSQEALSKDEDALLTLIGGNSPLIERID